MEEKQLRSEVLSTALLAPALTEHLFRLFSTCYAGADPQRFRSDLEEKSRVILLREAAGGAVVGFSTQTLMEAVVERRRLRALFSGDTVIHPDYWGSQELVRAWCRLAGALKTESPSRPLYWFLISKGHRTYLYLACFFHRFYPRRDEPTPPFEKKLIAALATSRYGSAFNPATGVIERRGTADRLRPEIDSAERHRHHPDVEFFLRRNPRYLEGDELACVAEISPENMRSIARRELLAGMAAGPRMAAAR